MRTRGIIRGAGTALVACCAATWLASYWQAFEIYCWQKDSLWGGRSAICQYILRIDRARLIFHYTGWTRDCGIRITKPWRWITTPFPGGFLGFNLHDHDLTIPFWFLTLLATLLLGFLFKKSQPKPIGFPIEAASKHSNA